MAGVLFVVCIPREKYEKCISSKQQSSEEDGFGEANPEIYDSYSSLSIQDSSISSNSSIPNAGTSYAAESKIKNRSKNDIHYKRPREIQGSMDSDVFMRKVELETRANENEETSQKFFSVSPVDNLKNNTDKTMEFVMREIVDRMKIRNVSWEKVNNGNSYKVSFSLEKGIRCDDTIHLLSEHGIGTKKGSSCVIIPCSVYKDKSHLKKSNENSSDILFREISWNQHIGNIRARLNVEKLVHAVKSDATMSFDFIILLVVASIIASFGLVENSTLILTASMLISPLMGPILAATFGAVIKNHKLQFWGLRNEIIGIVLCIVVGYFFGIIVCLTDYVFDIQIKLTTEMLSRCTWRSVFIGVFIALASGAAQSIALLRENFGSLVGVAISASLLPPAVNTGLLWSFSNVNQIFQIFDIKAFGSYTIETTKYSENPAVELMVLGSLSLFLTLTNVVCVYVMGYIFLRIKIEVAPLSTDEERQFWKHDIPIARDYNKTVNDDDGRRVRDQLDDYLNSETGNFQGVAAELLKQDLSPNIHTWSPLMHKFGTKKENQRPSVIDFDAYFKSMQNRGDYNKNHHKHSESIATPKPSKSSTQHNPGSSTEPLKRHTTFVDIEDDSNDGTRSYRKFIVTQAKNDLM